MNIEQLINRGAEKYSPYANGLVNHLPMAQLALYKLTDSIEIAEEYTGYYLERTNIDKVKEDYKKVDSIEKCLGKRDLYESCLELIREKLKEEDLDVLVSSILNRYILGLSSGLFHTTIRLAYAIEGYRIDNGLQKEVERALAYYVTGYKEGKLFKKKIPKYEVIEKMSKLIENLDIKEIRESDMSLGKKLKFFYTNKKFLERGFTVKGNEDDKVKSILELLIPAFYNTNNIVMLHTITGLQAIVTLKDYFANFNKAMDIFTTNAIVHILTQKNLDIKKEDTKIDKTWEKIIELVLSSKNVHTIKFLYTSEKLDYLYNIPELKYASNKRIVNERPSSI